MFEELKSNVSVMKELMQKVRNETKEDVRQACVDLITILNRGIPELMKKNSPVASENTTLQIVSVPYGTDKRTVFILPIDQRIYTTVVSRIAKKGRVVTKEAKKEEKKQKLSL